VFMLFCVMCVIVLYCIVLYFTVLYCPVLHCGTLPTYMNPFAVNNNNNNNNKLWGRLYTTNGETSNVLHNNNFLNTHILLYTKFKKKFTPTVCCGLQLLQDTLIYK
jgi:hypothetical protein